MRSIVWVCLVCAGFLVGEAQVGAAMWCAQPIEVHEWGVMVFDAHGKPITGLLPLPSWIYSRALPGASPLATSPVRSLPPDSGERALPVLQVFLPKTDWPMASDNIPLGLEVGFSQGVATAWFPSLDGLRSAAEANSPGAKAARQALLEKRAERKPYAFTAEALPSDPTRQLLWENLLLTQAPKNPQHAPEIPWVEDLRAAPGALWFNNGRESERFVFYEGRSVESPALAFEAKGGACALRNQGAFPVWDVFVVHRRPDGSVALGYMPTLAAGAEFSAGASLLDRHPADPKTLQTLTRDKLRAVLTTPPPAPVRLSDPKTPPNPMDNCVEGRDPALPIEAATHHALSEAEADALLKAWGPHMFDQPGLTLVYREDLAYLDLVMPVSIYTDMFHFVQGFHRTGLVVQQGLTPDPSCL